MSSVKSLFVSHTKGGELLEIDFSQLEVYTLAILAGEETLWKDLKSGRDLHTISACLYTGKDYASLSSLIQNGDPFSIAVRKTAKAITFSYLYGASAKGISKNLGIPLNKVESFLNEYDYRYPYIKKWWNKNQIEAIKNSKVVNGGEIYSFVRSPTGTKYNFKHYPNKYKPNAMPTPSPTEMKNYPNQGFATGDFIQYLLGEYYKLHIQHPDKYPFKMINTTHDSILFDLGVNQNPEDLKRLYDFFRDIGWNFINYFNIKLPNFVKEDQKTPLFPYSTKRGTEWSFSGVESSS